MRRLTTRIVPFLAALAAVVPATAVAQAPVRRRRRRPPAAALAVPALRRRQRAARQARSASAAPSSQRLAGRRGRRPVPRPRHPGVDEAGAHDRQARRHVRRPLEPRRTGAVPHRARSSAARRERRSASPELALTVFRRADRHLVRPRLLRQHDRVRHRADRGARRRRPPQPAVRDERRRALRVADARRPGRRPRAVRRRGAVGPHRRGRPAARLHADGPHRRGPPRPARSAGVQVADDPVRHRGQRRRRLLHRQRPLGQQRLDALAQRGVRAAARASRRPRAARRTMRGSSVHSASKRRSRSGTRASARAAAPTRAGTRCSRARRSRRPTRCRARRRASSGTSTGASPPPPERVEVGEHDARRRRCAPSRGSGARPRGSCARCWKAPNTTRRRARATIVSSSIAREIASSVRLRQHCEASGCVAGRERAVERRPVGGEVLSRARGRRRRGRRARARGRASTRRSASTSSSE